MKFLKRESQKESYITELLKTLKSIDSTLKRIKQAVTPKKHSEKDYECPFSGIVIKCECH